MSEYKKIIQYLAFDLTNKILPFVIPYFIASYLSPEELGFYTTKQLLFLLFFNVISMGGGAKILVSISKENGEEKDISSSLLKIFTFNMIVVLFLYIVLPFFDVNKDFIIDYIPLVICSFFYSVIQIQLSIYRGYNKIKAYGSLNLSLSVCVCIVIFSYVLYFRTQLGLWYCLIIPYGLFSFKFFKDHLAVRASTSAILHETFRFCFYQLPHVLSSWCRLGIDRLFLANLFTMSLVGYYSMMLQFGLIVSAVLQSLNNYYSPYLFKILSEKQNQKKTSLLAENKKAVHSSLIFFVASFCIVIIIDFFAYIVVHYFLPTEYSSYYYLVPVVTFAYGLQGCYFSVVNYIYFWEKTQYLNIPSILSCLFQIVIGYFLISKFSLLGASLSLVFSWGVQLLFTLGVLFYVKTKT
ncbi:lipopolysaccharide biosynthesis protein [Citrobacter sp. Res13-Sevr-PEB04-36]|uniref:lipopolysaccharide biosynthesis protein n=1 Tax=Citrobacter sp. Res13-Sevr-PEB04-36 TaxID=2777960 RepID=UPI0018ACD8F3|nr:oligosaccharide flippase family protein [Citrobacter sp. Res13-Sevr-PEB04-36]